MRLQTHDLQLFQIVCGIGLTAGCVAHVRNELKGGIGQLAPAHAALDGTLGKAGIGKECAAQARVLHSLECGVRAGHGLRVDHVVVFERQNLALVVGKRLVDEGVRETNAAPALNFLLVELKIGAIVRAAAPIGVEVDQNGTQACHRAATAATSNVREHRRHILKIAKDERIEVDAKKRFVHIENDCFEHAGTFLVKRS